MHAFIESELCRCKRLLRAMNETSHRIWIVALARKLADAAARRFAWEMWRGEESNSWKMVKETIMGTPTKAVICPDNGEGGFQLSFFNGEEDRKIVVPIADMREETEDQLIIALLNGLEEANYDKKPDKWILDLGHQIATALARELELYVYNEKFNSYSVSKNNEKLFVIVPDNGSGKFMAQCRVDGLWEKYEIPHKSMIMANSEILTRDIRAYILTRISGNARESKRCEDGGGSVYIDRRTGRAKTDRIDYMRDDVYQQLDDSD